MRVDNEVLLKLQEHLSRKRVSKERDDSLDPIPPNYIGSAVLRSKAVHLPIYVHSLGLFDGKERFSARLDLPHEEIRLEGGVVADRVGILPSDAANFFLGNIKPPKFEGKLIQQEISEDMDESMVKVPDMYRGPGVLELPGFVAPVVVEECSPDIESGQLAKLLLRLPEGEIRLYGKFKTGRIKALPSVVEKFKIDQRNHVPNPEDSHS